MTVNPTTSVEQSIQRYRPAQVALHWIIAILIFVTALLAGGAEGEGRRGAAAGLSTLALHMILGITVLVLLLIRVLMRWRTRAPEWATTGSSFLDRIGRWTHIALYFFAFAVTITGLVLALQTNRLAHVFGGRAFTPSQFQSGQVPPSQFTPPPGGFRPGGEGGEGGEGFEGGLARGGRFLLGAFHGFSWTLLLLLIILHVAAALYHQFIRRDNLFSRMWFGRTT